MGEKCRPYYRNLNTIQSYSEQKYATVQWCEQNCENDEWLKQQVDQLRYLTPPAVRKSWNINDFIDFKKSYGVSSLGTNQVGFSNGGHRTITLNFTEDDEIKVDESYTQNSCEKITQDYIDNNSLDDNGNPTKTHKTWYQLPEDVSKIEYEKQFIGTTKDGSGENTSWHISFDKSKNYYVRPDWLKNWKDGEIPSVVRAQTFKNLYEGNLVQLDLGLDWSGTKTSDCGSPLYIQIWKTYNRFIYKKKWNNAKWKKCMEYIYKKPSEISNYQSHKEKYDNSPHYNKTTHKLTYKTGKKKGQVKKYPKDHKKEGQEIVEDHYVKANNGEYVRVRENVKWLGHNHWNSTKKKWDGDRYYPLAEAVYTGHGADGEKFPSIVFDKELKLEVGETYGIVLFSPLSEYKHCPRWRGWGRNCRKDKVYKDGVAWLSTNNGRTWVRYGKDGIDTITDSKGNARNLTYHEGKYTPQDFMFQCHIQKPPTEVRTFREGIHYVYFEPIYDNPIESVTINAYGDGLKETSHPNIHISFDINPTGDDGGWIEDIDLGQRIYMEKDNQNGEFPTALVVRAKLWHDEGYNETPILNQVIIDLDTLPSKEFYARSIDYTPRTVPMLGANIWGRLYAPFDYDAEVECNVEIIEGKPVTEYFDIINPSSLVEYMDSLEMDTSQIKNLDVNGLVSYLESHTDLIDELKENKIYLRPFVDGDDLHLLSFSNTYNREDMVIGRDETYTDSVIYPDFLVGGINFTNEVAFPVGTVDLQPVVIEQSGENKTPVDTYKEFLDFDFDYETNQLIFKDGVIDELTDGKLSVTYNPIFISRLNREDVGRRIDVETGEVEEGLILDYFKETITITDEHVRNRSVDLRVKPVDPIREVLLYKYNRANEDDYIKLYENVDYELKDTNTSKKNSLVFSVNSMDNQSSIISAGDTLVVVYTPAIYDNTLYVGYYAKRKNTSMQCRLQNMYWEYKA